MRSSTRYSPRGYVPIHPAARTENTPGSRVLAAFPVRKDDARSTKTSG